MFTRHPFKANTPQCRDDGEGWAVSGERGAGGGGKMKATYRRRGGGGGVIPVHPYRGNIISRVFTVYLGPNRGAVRILGFEIRAVWYGTVRYGTERSGPVRSGPVRYGTVRCG